MPNTSNLVLPYPGLTNAPNVPADLQALALAVDAPWGAWTAYTPTWTGTGFAIGNGTITGAYQKTGKNVVFRILATIGSTTTVGTGTYLFGLPVTAAVTLQPLGGFLRDQSPFNEYNVSGTMNSTTTFRLIYGNTPVSGTSPFTFVSTDVISAGGTYEAA